MENIVRYVKICHISHVSCNMAMGSSDASDKENWILETGPTGLLFGVLHMQIYEIPVIHYMLTASKIVMFVSGMFEYQKSLMNHQTRVYAHMTLIIGKTTSLGESYKYWKKSSMSKA